MSDFTDEIDAFRYLLKLAEDLLMHSGIPEELKKKYNLVKDITLEKIRAAKLGCT